MYHGYGYREIKSRLLMWKGKTVCHEGSASNFMLIIGYLDEILGADGMAL